MADQAHFQICSKPDRRRIIGQPHDKKGTYRIACANDLAGTYCEYGIGFRIPHRTLIVNEDGVVWELSLVSPGSMHDRKHSSDSGAAAKIPKRHALPNRAEIIKPIGPGEITTKIDSEHH